MAYNLYSGEGKFAKPRLQRMRGNPGICAYPVKAHERGKLG